MRYPPKYWDKGLVVSVIAVVISIAYKRME